MLQRMVDAEDEIEPPEAEFHECTVCGRLQSQPLHGAAWDVESTCDVCDAREYWASPERALEEES